MATTAPLAAVYRAAAIWYFQMTLEMEGDCNGPEIHKWFEACNAQELMSGYLDRHGLAAIDDEGCVVPEHMIQGSARVGHCLFTEGEVATYHRMKEEIMMGAPPRQVLEATVKALLGTIQQGLEGYLQCSPKKTKFCFRQVSPQRNRFKRKSTQL